MSLSESQKQLLLSSKQLINLCHFDPIDILEHLKLHFTPSVFESMIDKNVNKETRIATFLDALIIAGNAESLFHILIQHCNQTSTNYRALYFHLKNSFTKESQDDEWVDVADETPSSVGNKILSVVKEIKDENHQISLQLNNMTTIIQSLSSAASSSTVYPTDCDARMKALVESKDVTWTKWGQPVLADDKNSYRIDFRTTWCQVNSTWRWTSILNEEQGVHLATPPLLLPASMGGCLFWFRIERLANSKDSLGIQGWLNTHPYNKVGPLGVKVKLRLEVTFPEESKIWTSEGEICLGKYSPNNKHAFLLNNLPLQSVLSPPTLIITILSFIQ